ncbi:hypothetical protein DFQ26_001092 [Actinomortierella ambigua]|nr:hypothetical protein DFQ26_001092 [Actinomortierella ambigua]
MGNAITKNYEVGGQIASAGLWKIHRGTKRTTGQEVAIFEKNIVESISSLRRQTPSKRDQERVYEFLKKEASQLARLRHPAMLEVVEPVDESRTAIAFATEPIFASLSNLLGNYENLPNVTEDIRKFEMDELELQKGLLQIGKGLQFCHNDAKIVHGNLVPDAIFVNAKGDWKISGFGFSTFLSREPGVPTTSDYWEYDHDLHPYCQRDLDYQAPEYALDQRIDPSNDMFGVGCLAYAVLNKGTPLLNTHGNLNTYRQQVERISMQSYEKFPHHLQEAMQRLITRDPMMRMNAVEFQSSKFFDNILVSTMRYMETFAEKTRDDKSQFMKGLLRVLSQFPERVLYKKILPALLDEMKDHALLPFTMPNVFYIAEKMTPREFEDKVLPALKPIFLVREPVQNLLTLLEKIDMLQQKVGGAVFKEDVMPLVYCALEPRNPPSVQEKALKTVPAITESLDYTTVKASLFPRIATLFVQTTTLSVKINTLVCFHTLMKTLDKFTMTEKLLPLLKNIKTREPNVSMATLIAYQEMGKYVDKEVIGNAIIPQLWHLALGPNLKAEQFEKFMSVIQELSTKVHQQHLKHLQDLKKLEEQTKSYTSTASEGNPLANGATGTMTDFEKLVGGGVGGGLSATGSLSNGRHSSSSSNSVENPFKTSDNPFSPSSTARRQESSGDIFADITPSSFGPSSPSMSSLPPPMATTTSIMGGSSATRPMSLTGGSKPQSSTPSMFGAISADTVGVGNHFGSSRPLTPITSNHTGPSSFMGTSSSTSGRSTPTLTPTSAASTTMSSSSSTPFSIPPLSKPPGSSSSSSTTSPRLGNYVGAPAQKPGNAPPLSHTLANLSTSSAGFGGFQSAMSNSASSSTGGHSIGGMGGFGSTPSAGFGGMNGGGSGMGGGMGMGMSSMTPMQPARPTMAPMGSMTPLQPMVSNTGMNANRGTGTTGKSKADLNMFDPFS